MNLIDALRDPLEPRLRGLEGVVHVDWQGDCLVVRSTSRPDRTAPIRICVANREQVDIEIANTQFELYEREGWLQLVPELIEWIGTVLGGNLTEEVIERQGAIVGTKLTAVVGGTKQTVRNSTLRLPGGTRRRRIDYEPYDESLRAP